MLQIGNLRSSLHIHATSPGQILPQGVKNNLLQVSLVTEILRIITHIAGCQQFWALTLQAARSLCRQRFSRRKDAMLLLHLLLAQFTISVTTHSCDFRRYSIKRWISFSWDSWITHSFIQLSQARRCTCLCTCDSRWICSYTHQISKIPLGS